MTFNDLGLIVIDEQHRFGVSDRMRMVAKGFAPHVLVMSATPIPRTLALSIHGDMDLSVLDEKPPGRQPIKTATMPISRIDEVIEAIGDAAQTRRARLLGLPADRGKRSGRSRRRGRSPRRAASVFRQGRRDRARQDDARPRAKRRWIASAPAKSFLMVATTVIEVGVNVPEATIMVIEHAERFGLAQLHQLRGRVGRGDKQGSCVLLWKPPLGEGAKKRLDAIRRNDDGFAIAEIDFKLRGAGDVLGTQQSGLPPFRLVSPEAHADMLGRPTRKRASPSNATRTSPSARGEAIRLVLACLATRSRRSGRLARSG